MYQVNTVVNVAIPLDKNLIRGDCTETPTNYYGKGEINLRTTMGQSSASFPKNI